MDIGNRTLNATASCRRSPRDLDALLVVGEQLDSATPGVPWVRSAIDETASLQFVECLPERPFRQRRSVPEVRQRDDVARHVLHEFLFDVLHSSSTDPDMDREWWGSNRRRKIKPGPHKQAGNALFSKIGRLFQPSTSGGDTFTKSSVSIRSRTAF